MTLRVKARRRLGAIAALACAAMLWAGDPALAETWRMSTKLPADSPEGRVFQHFADDVKEYSKGQLTVTVYPSEQLGREDAVLEQLQLGTVQIYAESSLFLQKWVPDIKWMSAPFLFRDRATWVRFVDGPLVQGWFQAATAKAGIKPLGEVTDVVRGPYRVLVASRPVATLADLKGLKLRMYPDQLAVDVWTHLGAEPQMLGWTETYQGLKSGIVGSVTTPVGSVESMRFYEVAPNIVRTNEFWQEIAFMTNARAFDRLAPELKAALLQAHKETGAYSAKLMNEVADGVQARLEAKGVKFMTLAPDEVFSNMKAWYDAQQKAGKLPAGFTEAVAAAMNGSVAPAR